MLEQWFLKARNNNRMKFYLMWANHNARTIWDKRTSELKTVIWNGAVDRKIFENIVNRTIQNYFTHPSYYKIDGKPVYMFYDIENLVHGLGGVDAAKDALDYFREQTIKAGFPGLELQITIRSRGYMSTKFDDKTDIFTFINDTFDSVTHYQFRDFIDLKEPTKYMDVLEDVKREWDYIDKNIKIAYYPHVSVGWDANPRFNNWDPRIFIENTPENVKKGFELAKDYVDSHKNLRSPLITVNSWNEWTETSYLQPDDLYGYEYLNIIKSVFL